jgi:hypothetical protein
VPDYNMKPLFQRVLLKVEVLKEQELFGEEPGKPKVYLLDTSSDCHGSLYGLIGSQVLFNGIIAEVVEETEDYKVVLTHETNLLMSY